MTYHQIQSEIRDEWTQSQLPKTTKTKKRKLPVGVYDLPEVKTRVQALTDGDTLYWSGKVCENGHHAPRYSRDNVCKECYRIKRQAWKEAASN